MKRYLIYFSYIGSGFRGIQRQIGRNQNAWNSVPTVSEVIEDALKRRLQLPEIPILHTASRTDAGVHALKTCAHVDMDVCRWTPANIQLTLNYYFQRISCPIKVLKIQRVKDDFSSRSMAVSRSYLYRFAVLKQSAVRSDWSDDTVSRRVYQIPTPVTEYLRCHFIPNSKFDVEVIRDMLPLFIGDHDFRTFMAKLSNGTIRQLKQSNKELVTVRSLYQFELHPGRSFLPSSFDDNYDYWEFRCSARSFLYKQVRRMVSVLLSAAQGVLTKKEVIAMFENPSKDSWSSKINTVPSHGLYLTDVVYKDEDLIEPVDELVNEPDEDVKVSPKDLAGLSITEKINLRNKNFRRENKELPKRLKLLKC